MELRNGIVGVAFLKLAVSVKVLAHMVRLAHQYQILNPVVVTDAVDVVDNILARQLNAVSALVNQTVLKHVSVSVCRWMRRFVDVNIAGLVLPSAALPAGTQWADCATGIVAVYEPKRESDVLPAVLFRHASDRRRLTATALANTGRRYPIGGRNDAQLRLRNPQCIGAGAVLHLHEVLVNVARRMIAVMGPGWNYLAAAALTNQRRDYFGCSGHGASAVIRLPNYSIHPTASVGMQV